MDNRDIILGLDSGTSVVKAVAFDLEGQQLGCASARNRYSQRGPRRGAAVNEPDRQDAVAAIRKLAERVDNLAARVVAIAVTARATALAGRGREPPGL